MSNGSPGERRSLTASLPHFLTASLGFRHFRPPALTGFVVLPLSRDLSSLPSPGLHLLRPGDSAREGGGELPRRLEGQLDGGARAGPQLRVHEIDRDRVLEQRVVRVVVRHHRARDREPALLALRRAGGGNNLNY